MEIILPFQCFELWLMIIIDERDWLTTFPKDTHIKFHSQQVGVWETGRACPQTPLACSACKGNVPSALWFCRWVCSQKPSQSWLPLPQHHALHFLQSELFLPVSDASSLPDELNESDAWTSTSIPRPPSVTPESLQSRVSRAASPVVRWLRLCTPNAGAGFTPCSGLEPTHHT